MSEQEIIQSLMHFFSSNEKNPKIWSTNIGKVIKENLIKRDNWKKSGMSKESARRGYIAMKYSVAKEKGFEGSFQEFDELWRNGYTF
jgi:hypothetical protein